MIQPDNETERTVLNFFVTLGSGDLDRVRPLCHPNVIWRVMGRGIPGEGVHHGVDAIFAFIVPIRALFAPGSPEVEITSLASKGNQVIFEAKGGGKLKDGREYDNYYVMALEVADGLIREIREYMDTFYVNRLLGSR